MTEQHQPLSREEHLCRICTGVLAFLDKQIAEMESFEPWDVEEEEKEAVDKMIGEYRDVTFALRLAVQSADGVGHPQVEIKTAFEKS